MKIKKYDRFIRDDQIIEVTGLEIRRMGGSRLIPVFKIVNPSPGKKNEFRSYKPEELERAGFKRLAAKAYSHPLLSEIGAELEANPAFGETLIKFLVMLARSGTDEEKNKVFGWLKKHIPVEWLATLETIPLYAGKDEA